MHLTHTEVQEFFVTELFQKSCCATSEAGPRIGTCVTILSLLMGGIWAQNFYRNHLSNVM